MPRTLEPVARSSRVVFELDRFELVNDDQYELRGRWFGVRGRRFIRPTLTMTVDDKPVRLLADLAHKPWATEDGQPWVAAFPTRFEGEVQQAELTVAPDITIELRAPGAPKPTRSKTPSGERAQPKATPRPAGHSEATSPSLQVVEATTLSRELADAHQRQQQLQRQLDRAEAGRARATARMDELLGNLSEAMHDREQAHAARDQALAQLEELDRARAGVAGEREAALMDRDSARQERDAARQERDAALQERDTALQLRDEALAASQAAVQARDEALGQRGAAIAAREQAESERDTALQIETQAEAECQAAHALRGQAQAERDEARAVSEQAIRERESIRAALEQLNSEMARHVSSRGAAMVMRRAAQEPPSFRTGAPVLPRALAIILMMAVIVAALLVLHVA